MRPIAIIFAACAMGTGMLSAYLLAKGAVDYVEQSTEWRLRIALNASGDDWVEIVTDGLVVRLKGEAVTEARRFRALQAVTQLIASERIVDQTTIRNEVPITAPEFSLNILRSPDRISVIGLVPAMVTRRRILDAMAKADGSAELVDMLDSTTWPAPAHWEDSLALGLEIAARLTQAKISVTPGRVAVTAAVDDGTQLTELTEAFEAARPKDVALSLDLSAPRPVIAPFRTDFLLTEDGAMMAHCSVETEAGRSKILAAAQALGAEGGCQIGLGAPTPSWPDAVVASINALSEIGGGFVEIVNIDISLSALSGTDPAIFDQAISRLRTKLPPLFSLHPTLPSPAEIVDTSADLAGASFSATLDAEGNLLMTGSLHDDMAKLTTTTFAEAQFGSTRVRDATRTRANLPEGWQVHILSGIEALAFLHSGKLGISEETLHLTGVVGTTEERAAIITGLATKLGASLKVTTDISVDPTLVVLAEDDGEPDTLSAKACAEDIATILTEQQIAFAPSSSTIATDGLNVVNAITKVLQLCPGARFEVAGHTDSQGSEGGNMALSQARADAVVGALFSRRLDLVYLTAKGYGEGSPIADNETEEGRAANRRIEFILQTSPPAAPAEGEVVADPAPDAAPVDPAPEPVSIDTVPAPGAAPPATTESEAEPAAEVDPDPASLDTEHSDE